jgi:hypothetical protein
MITAFLFRILSSLLLSKNLKKKLYFYLLFCMGVSLALREEHGLGMFENWVPRRIFGLKRETVTEDWRRLHNDELRNLYASPSIIRVIKLSRMRLAGHAARVGETRNACIILVGKPEGKRPLGIPRSRGVDNIRMIVREIGWDVVDGFIWIRIGASCGL